MKLETRQLSQKEAVEINSDIYMLDYLIPVEGWEGDEVIEVICDGEVLCKICLPIETIKSFVTETRKPDDLVFGLNFVTKGHYQ